MLLYPKPTLRLNETDLAELADVPSPSASPAPPRRGSRTNAFFSTGPTVTPTPSRTNSFFNSPITTKPPSPITPAPTSPLTPTLEDPTPKASPKDVWWAKLARRKRSDSIPSPILTTTTPSLTADFPHHDRSLPSPTVESPVTIESPDVTSCSEPHVELVPDQRISSADINLTLVRALGKGSFSTVWLARDTSAVPLHTQARIRRKELRRKKSSLWGSTFVPEATNTNPDSRLSPEGQEVDLLRRRSSSKRSGVLALGLPKDAVQGVRPTRQIGNGQESRAVSMHLDGYTSGSISRASSTSSMGSQRSKDGLVAVKLVERSVLESPNFSGAMTHEEREKDRTRVSFVREVEVLKHISHPNIAPLFAQLATPTHHLLVLPFIPGGDLLALVRNPVGWSKLKESVLQRIFGDIVSAVGWMHSVGLVHRDIKLENILLATTSFLDLTPDSVAPSLETIFPSAHHRFTSSSSCNSLSMHASPPLIKITDFGLSRFISPSSPLLHTRCGSEAYAAPELIINSSAGYDARETDSWACGVCLYELSCRTLPFGSDDEGISNRRKWLFRIALGEFTWPESAENVCIPDDEERMGSTLSSSPDVRRVVARLLVRDAKKRAAIGDLWDDPWISDSRHELASDSGHSTASSLEVRSTLHQEMMARTTSSLSEDAKPVPDIMANGVEDDGLDEDTEEWIVDVPEKDSISRQELT